MAAVLFRLSKRRFLPLTIVFTPSFSLSDHGFVFSTPSISLALIPAAETSLSVFFTKSSHCLLSLRWQHRSLPIQAALDIFPACRAPSLLLQSQELLTSCVPMLLLPHGRPCLSLSHCPARISLRQCPLPKSTPLSSAFVRPGEHSSSAAIVSGPLLITHRRECRRRFVLPSPTKLYF
jgi:hypothetical protein